MEYGHKAEPLIRKLVALNLKGEYKIEQPKGYVLYRRKDKPYLTATVDSLMKEIEDIDNDGKNYQTSVYFMDIINAYEKMGDYMINVSQDLERGFINK